MPSSSVNRLHAPPPIPPEEIRAGRDAVFPVGSFVFIDLPECSWSDAQLRAHLERLRGLLQDSADPVLVVPNVRLTLRLLAERGIHARLALPRALG